MIYIIFLFCRFTAQNEGKDVELTEAGGIDILGNIVEASILSVNRDYYGDIHNMGHLAIALAHDPDGRYLVGALTHRMYLDKSCNRIF